MDRRHFLGSATATGLISLLPAPILAAARREALVGHFALEQNRVWIAVQVGQAKPMLFVLDTGAGFAYIRPEQGTAMNMQQVGGKSLGGLGKKTVLGTSFIAHDVLFAGMIRQSTVGFAGYDFQRGLPPDASGLLSAGLITTRDSDLDFEKKEWRLWPDGRPDREGLTPLSSRITGQTGADNFSARMTVDAVIDGRSYKLIVDTGAPGDLLLFPSGTARSGLYDRPFSPEPTSGFGGRAAKVSRRVRATQMQLGPLVVDRPLVTLMDPKQVSHDFQADGLIGLQFIRLLDWSTDVRAAKIWVRRNGLPQAEPGYRLSGVWLDKDASGATKVSLVGGGSPAEKGGVRTGDIVIDPPTFEDAIRAIGGKPGRAVKLGLQRGGQRIEASYTLADWV